jgi:2,5-dihydroxypyridine 5,6-dioxygenase
MGNPLVDEKVFGTAHVALGDNAHMGGSVSSKIHIDGIVLEPSIELDGVPLMERGGFLD